MLVLSLISISMFLLALSNCSSSTGSANSLGYTDVAISLNGLCWRWRWSRRQLIRFWFVWSPCRRLRVWSLALLLLQWNSHSLWFCYFYCLRLVLTQMLALQLDWSVWAHWLELLAWRHIQTLRKSLLHFLFCICVCLCYFFVRSMQTTGNRLRSRLICMAPSFANSLS